MEERSEGCGSRFVSSYKKSDCSAETQHRLQKQIGKYKGNRVRREGEE